MHDYIALISKQERDVTVTIDALSMRYTASYNSLCCLIYFFIMPRECIFNFDILQLFYTSGIE